MNLHGALTLGCAFRLRRTLLLPGSPILPGSLTLLPLLLPGSLTLSGLLLLRGALRLYGPLTRHSLLLLRRTLRLPGSPTLRGALTLTGRLGLRLSVRLGLIRSGAAWPRSIHSSVITARTDELV